MNNVMPQNCHASYNDLVLTFMPQIFINSSNSALHFLRGYYKNNNTTSPDTSRKEIMFEIFHSKNLINPWIL